MPSFTVSVEYFGPCKEYTKGQSMDTIMLDTHTQQNNMRGVFEQLLQKYGAEFVEFIMTSCGVVLNYNYIDLMNRTERNTMFDELERYRLTQDDEVVIVPPVSAG